MNKIEQYIKKELKDCPLTEVQENKLLIGLTKFLDDLEAEQLNKPDVSQRISHFVSDIGQKYPATDEAILIEIEDGILRFYELGYDFERIYLKPVYVV